MAAWSFLTNHAFALTVINQRPDSTGLEVAQAVGVTERAARRIISDLEKAGYLDAERIGRRKRYRVHLNQPLGRFGDRELTVGEFLLLVEQGEENDGAGDRGLSNTHDPPI